MVAFDEAGRIPNRDTATNTRDSLKPLVSILISAYNAQEWIADSLQSAVAQTWPHKEIIVVDDGSTDRTAEVARRFASKGVIVFSTENHGLSEGQNRAFAQSRGDYIQFLDADDLLARNKIERQLAGLRATDSKRVLISSPWAPFYYRTCRAQFVRNSLWQDLSPVDWLLRKMSQNLHMQNATWLVSRELAVAAGPWDTRLQYDQDGEYFARVLLASEGTRFVPGTGIFYRATGAGSISYIGNSHEKKESLLLSMTLHIQYLRSLENSERVRIACLQYLQNWYHHFYPDRPDLVTQLHALAIQLDGHLEMPRLRWKYAWMKPVFGWKVAKSAQSALPQFKNSFIRQYDKAMYLLDASNARLPLASKTK
jgi:glycosyltransferase involved in cell wall biosynthesis